MARVNRRLTRASRYGKYAGGPDPLAAPVDIAEALDAIGQEVMAGYSPERAMREFLRRGGKDRAGLDELARRVADRRRELTQKHNLDGTLQEIRELLDKAVLAERKQLARDAEMDDADRALAQMQLDNLPASPAAAVSELSEYNWQSPDARADYEKIKDLLGRELLDQRFAGMKKALENATDEDRAAINEMLKDLNQLLDAHKRGEDSQQQFDDFMQKHGEYFPENPQNIDELLDSLAQRAAAAQRMRNSMTQEQRDELDGLAQQAFGSPELMQSLSELDGNLQSLRPGENWGGSESMDGSNGLGLGDGTGVFQDLADLDELADQLSQSYNGSDLDDLDLDKLARQLGDEAAVDAKTLQQLERALRDSGTLKRGSDGTLKLTPKAMRQLGKALLRDVANRLSGRQGNRDVRQAGAAGERSGATREWAFGDTEPWDVTRTITNAITRTAGEVSTGSTRGGSPLGSGEVSTGSTRGGQPVVSTGSTRGGEPVVSTGSTGGGQAVVSTGSTRGGQPVVSTGSTRGVQPVVSTGSTRGGQAVVSTGSTRGGEPLGASLSRPRLRIEIGDVEVQETEARTQAAVALLVDTSFSMVMDGRWVPMKRTALALHTLITSRFRGDDLQLIAFGRHAEVIDIEQLTALDEMYNKGTNLHHALLLANRHFRKHPNAQPVLLIVTDGEPTSHLEASGDVFFSYPPHPVTIAFAIRELDNSMRLGAQTTFFRLGDDPGLARFIDSMARRVGGSVVAPELDDLGAAVVSSYLGSRGRPGSARPTSGEFDGMFGRGWGY